MLTEIRKDPDLTGSFDGLEGGSTTGGDGGPRVWESFLEVFR